MPRAARSATAATTAGGAKPQLAARSAWLKSTYVFPSTSVNRQPSPCATWTRPVLVEPGHPRHRHAVGHQRPCARGQRGRRASLEPRTLARCTSRSRVRSIAVVVMGGSMTGASCRDSGELQRLRADSVTTPQQPGEAVRGDRSTVYGRPRRARPTRLRPPPGAVPPGLGPEPPQPSLARPSRTPRAPRGVRLRRLPPAAAGGGGGRARRPRCAGRHAHRARASRSATSFPRSCARISRWWSRRSSRSCRTRSRRSSGWRPVAWRWSTRSRTRQPTARRSTAPRPGTRGCSTSRPSASPRRASSSGSATRRSGSSSSTRRTACRSGATTSGRTTSASPTPHAGSGASRSWPRPRRRRPQVAATSSRRLGLRDPVRVATGFDRPNLSFAVVQCPTKEAGHRASPRRCADPEARPAIVYAGTRNELRQARRPARRGARRGW